MRARCRLHGILTARFDTGPIAPVSRPSNAVSPATVMTEYISTSNATLQNGGILVITGKGYGSTNLLALDRNGRVIMSKTVRVQRRARRNRRP